MTTKLLATEQINLRVKRGSQVDKMLRMFLSNPDRFIPDSEFKVMGSKCFVKRMSHIFKSMENVTIKYDKTSDSATARYTDLFAKVPVPVSVSTPTLEPQIYIQTPTALPLPREFEAIVWPETPGVPLGLGDKFREPSWFRNMEKMVWAGRHISLSGAPGVGKDSAVIELAATYNKPLVFVGGDAGFRRRDLVGSMQVANGHSFFEVAEYAAATVNGWWAVISEINAADADAVLFLNQQLAAPYAVQIAGKSYPVHPDFRMFITYNPGLIGTKPLPQSFKDRFFSINVPWFSKVQLKSLLTAHGMPTDKVWAETLVYTAMEIWNAHERGTVRYQVTTRRLMDVVELMSCCYTEFELEAAMMAGIVAALDSPIEAKTVTQIIKNCVQTNGGL